VTSRQSILLILLALVLVRGLLYASLVPPWQAPDEPPQFERARAARTAAEWNSNSANAPAWYPDLINSLCLFSFWDFLPAPRRACAVDVPLNRYLVLYQEVYSGLYSSRLPYAVIGWPSFLTHHLDITLQLYLVRLNTVLMNVGVIFLAYLITRTIFPGDTFLSLGVPLLILFNPQHTHLLSTINNGNLAELLAMVALYFMIKAIIEGYTWLNLLAIFGFALAAMWTKATAYFLPFVIGTLALFYLWRYRRYGVWLAPIIIILAGLSYFFSPERLKLLLEVAWDRLRAGDIYLDPIVPIVQFRSFWAMPGWLTLQLHPFWYQVLAIGAILALVGLVILLVTRWRLLFLKQFQPQFQALILLAISALVALAIIWGWSALDKTIVYRQGRSLYPVIVSIALFLMLGWRQLIPAPWRNLGLLTITAALFLFDLIVMLNYIIPFFYSRY
jgi:hypothetical protein